jgi:type II secretory pathway pseudopilin PulG
MGNIFCVCSNSTSNEETRSLSSSSERQQQQQQINQLQQQINQQQQQLNQQQSAPIPPRMKKQTSLPPLSFQTSLSSSSLTNKAPMPPPRKNPNQK